MDSDGLTRPSEAVDEIDCHLASPSFSHLSHFQLLSPSVQRSFLPLGIVFHFDRPISVFLPQVWNSIL